MEVARLLAVYDADTRGFDEKSRDVEATLGKLSGGGVMGGFIGAQIFMQAASALGGLAAEGVTAYASFERLGFSLQTLTAKEMMNTGQMHNMTAALAAGSEKSKELVNWIQQLAVKSPFTREGVSAAFQQAMAYGFASDEAQRLTQATIDYAAGSGRGEGAMNSIALALGQIQAKGKLAGQEVLQLVNTGIPVQQILAQAFDKTTAEIAKMTERGLIPADAAIEAIVSSMERDFGGAAARMAESVSGLISTLSDIKDINLTAFFGGFFEQVQPLLADFVEKMSDPAMQENMAELGRNAGELVVTLVDGGKAIADAWNATPEWLRNSAVALIAINAVTPNIIDGLARGAVALGGWGSTLKSLPGFYRDVRAGQALLQEGAGAFSVMSSGAAGLTATLGPLAISLAALAAVAVTYNQTVAKSQNAGLAANTDAWAGALSNVAKNGGSASQVIAAYAAGIEQVNAAHASGGLVADVFVNRQKIVLNGLSATVTELSKTAQTWDEYQSSVSQAAEMAGYMVDEQGRAYTLQRMGAGVVKKYTDNLGQMTKSEWLAADAIKNASLYMDGHDIAASAAAKSLLTLGTTAISADKIMQSLGNALKSTDGDTAGIYASIADAVGLVVEPAAQAAADVDLLSNAFAQGLIGRDEYLTFMQSAQDGTLALDGATRSSIQGQLDNAAATRDAAQAAAGAAREYWGLTESLKNATEADFAKQMLGQLGELLKGDTPNVAAYNNAYKDLALSYGFANEKSMALAGVMPTLTQAIQSGQVAPEKLSEAINYLFQDAADGAVDWDAFADKFVTAGASFAPAQAAIDETGASVAGFGTDVTETGAVVETKMPEWVKSAQITSDEIAKAFTGENWAGVGIAITDGISAGLSRGIGKVADAARAAARAAYAAAAQELDIHSPSKRFEFLGEMALRGFEKPFLGNELQPSFQSALVPNASTVGASSPPQNGGAVELGSGTIAAIAKALASEMAAAGVGQ